MDYMRLNTALLISILIILLLGGLVLLSQPKQNNNILGINNPTPTTTDQNTTGNEPIIPSTTPYLSGGMTVDLASINENLKQSGTATLTEEGDKVKVVINLNTVSGLDNQPAHIHTGSCPNPGKVVFTLNSVKNGKSETLIDAGLESLKNSLPLAINVHKSSQESTVYTACGNLE